MSTAVLPTQDTGRSAKWGGATLALGAIVYTIAIVLYVTVYGQPKGTGPGGEVTVGDSAAHVLAKWGVIKIIWFGEMTGALLMGLGAFVLSERRPAARSWVPARVAWIAVGVGAILLAVMYASILGSYPIAAGAYAKEPTVFAALRGGAIVLFETGAAIVLLGIGGAFLAEASSDARAIPKWLALLGAVVAFLATSQAFAILVGIQLTAIAAPSALLAFFLTGIFGAAIWRQARRT